MLERIKIATLILFCICCTAALSIGVSFLMIASKAQNLRQAEQNISQLQHELQTLKLAHERSELNAKAATLSTPAVEELTTKIMALQAKIDSVQADSADLRQSITTPLATLAELKHELATLRTQHAQPAPNQATHRPSPVDLPQLNDLNQRLEALRLQIEQLYTDNADLRQTVATLQAYLQAPYDTTTYPDASTHSDPTSASQPYSTPWGDGQDSTHRGYKSLRDKTDKILQRIEEFIDKANLDFLNF